MKQLITIILVTFSLCFANNVNAQKHRHHSSQTSAAVTSKNANASSADAALDSASQGVVAFSDTTSLDSAVEHVADTFVTMPNFAGDGVRAIDTIFNSNAFTAISIVAIFFGFLFLALPVIVIAIILYFFYKRSKEKNKLIQQAIDKGVDIPQAAIPAEQKRDDVNVRAGIKHIAVGLGLVVMFYVMDSDFLCAIGWFVAIYGAGQIAIAHFAGNDGSEDTSDSGEVSKENDIKLYNDDYDKSE